MLVLNYCSTLETFSYHLHLLCAHHLVSVPGRTGRPTFSYSSSSYGCGNTLRFMFCKSQVTLVAFLWTLFYWSMFIFKNIAQKKTENPIYSLSAAKQIEMTSSLDLQKILMLTQNDSCLFASLIWHI